MQQNIIWQGIEYHSLENCILNTTEKGVSVRSVIIGHYEGILYQVAYQLYANSRWETERLDVMYQLGNKVKKVHLRSDLKGHWSLNDSPAPQFEGCMDVDITLTCLTNTLPIRRLDFIQQATHAIKVVYVDVLGETISPASQQYTRQGSGLYKFENVPNDFEALIKVDDSGLVMFYPELFERSAMAISDYPL